MNKIEKYKIPLEHELNKPANEYTREEIELLKLDYIKIDNEEALYLEYRRDELFNDGREMIDKIYKSMTQEEKMGMLRKKQREKSRYGI